MRHAIMSVGFVVKVTFIATPHVSREAFSLHAIIARSLLWIVHWSGVASSGSATFWNLPVLLLCAPQVDCGGTRGQNKLWKLTGELCVYVPVYRTITIGSNVSITFYNKIIVWTVHIIEATVSEQHCPSFERARRSFKPRFPRKRVCYRAYRAYKE